jgi:hypothetical protein
MIAVLLAAGLAIAVVLLWWFRPVEDTPPVTEAAPATTTTTTTTTLATTTTTLATTTTTTTDAGSHVVETVEEAEEILRELWFGWFEGIYHQDEDRIREVVATEQMLNSALNAFGAPFEQAPTPEGIHLEVEILRSTPQCLVTWGTLDITDFRGPEATTNSVQVLRYFEGSWKFMASWIHRDDLWESDCEAELLPLS